MIKYKVKTTATDSVSSVALDNRVGVHLKHTAKLFPSTDIRDEVDQYEVFLAERDACSQYRLILTIHPYCTNILFNTLTEIVKDEGSDAVKIVTDTEDANITGDVSKLVQGPTSPSRNHMIMNTEYSREDVGYDYLPGYDLFNNHIMRNTSFKMVNKKGTYTGMPDRWEDFDDETLRPSKAEQVFNTIGDTLRTKDGERIAYKKRTKVSTISGPLYRHLYLNNDILAMENGDAINENITEENGWVGFKNTSTISAEERERETYAEWNDMDISRVLNNHENCDFVDMYPDRTLYSFNPKYNKFRHRPEYNWNVAITYPYRSDTNHPIVSNETDGDGRTNALLIMSVKKVDGNGDTPVLLFRTYCKHGLSRNHNIYLHYSEDGGMTYTKTSITYQVSKLGDLNGDYSDYYFQMTDLSPIEDILGSNFWYDDYGKFSVSNSTINNEFAKKTLRLTHVVNGGESEYYVRIFRKLPNLRARKKNLTADIAEDADEFEKYVAENATETGSDRFRNFNKEQYQLAFASTIYSDACTQITFTDALDIEYLKDNLGRPLTDLYVTVVKNNAGFNKWYNGSGGDTASEDIEYSRCFGRITSGLLYHTEEGDESDTFINERGSMSDIRVINNLGLFESKTLGEYISVDSDPDWKNYGEGKTKENIQYTDNEFIGDIVEFIPCNAKEVVLSDVYHRFNTAQREVSDIGGESRYSKFQYQEISADDYDLANFTITNYQIQGNVERPEGYFYQAHYKLSLREFGTLQQAGHKDVRVKSATPVQLNGMYVKITTKIPHGVSVGDTVYICDDARGEWYTTRAVYVDSSTSLTIDILQNVNWVKLCDILNNTDSSRQYRVRGKNEEIPDYAVQVGSNKFLWREIVKNGESGSTLPEYIFANGYFYIESALNFFLRRQDPDAKNGLYNYAKDFFPNDIAGMIASDDTYDYEDLEELEC
ncbi:MAG: hypothetical protein LUD72_10220 [Bacteroidales bacterium]|nr:hypothetical protein [Bacteroidales bacterium]